MKRFLQALGVALVCTLPGLCLAAGSESVPLQATIRGPAQMVVGHTAILDAASNQLTSGTVTYTWFQQGLDKPISTSSEAFFVPQTPGTYTIRLLVKSDNGGEIRETTTATTVKVYQRKVVLITDASLSQDQLRTFRAQAESGSVFLAVIQPPVSTIPLAGQASFSQVVTDEFATIADSDAIINWTQPSLVGIQALLRAAGQDKDRLALLHNESIVVIDDGNLHTVSRTLRGPYSVLSPQRMFVTRPEAVPMVLQATDMLQFEEQVLKKDTEVIIQNTSRDSLRPWNIFSWIVTFMLKHGIPSQTVILLLMLPIIATILAFLKQFVGLTSFGLYTPSIIALSFLSLGWVVGLLFLLCIVFASYAARRVMRRWRMLFVPKMAIVLAFTSFILLLMLAVGAYFNIVLAPDTIFVLLIMSTLSESLLTTSIEEGWRSAIQGIVETIVSALLCVLIVRLPSFQSFILAYPEALLLTIVANILLGRYAGLRLTEYFRFRQLFAHLQEE